MSTAYSPVGLRVTQAYVRLFFVPESEDGARTISLARLGNYEVRLVELVQSDGACDPPLWVELYDRNIPGSIDSCSASDLEEMVCAAEQLLSEAKQLREGAEQGDMSGKVEQHRSNYSIRRTRCNSFKSHVCLLGSGDRCRAASACSCGTRIQRRIVGAAGPRALASD